MSVLPSADPAARHARLEKPMSIRCELTSAARSNHEAADRARRLARVLTDSAEIDRVERFAAELERQAEELEAKAAQLTSAAAKGVEA
jgi:transcription initiation factor TFIIIB Brf1 subunit/transcription initiation factor TFIIB